MAATHASKEAVWLQRLCSSMGVQGAIRIDCDNQSAIFLAKNPAYHSRTKHIDVQYHFVRDMIEDKKVLLVKVDTLKNIVDALTKSISSEKFSWCRETMGVSGMEKMTKLFCGPYVRLGEPTYGFVHDFRTCFLDAMVFGPWYWIDGFLVHGIGRDGFSVHGIGCFGMYKYVL